MTYCSPGPPSSRPEKLTEVEIGDYSVQTFMTNATTTTFKTNPTTVQVAAGPTTLFYPQRAVTGFQAQPWHYAVGAVLGLLLLAALVAALWKSGVFARLRLFQKKAEEAAGELKSTRSSVVRASVRGPSSRRAHDSGAGPNDRD